MRRMLVNLLLSAGMLYLISLVFTGVTLSGFASALVAALVLGFVNAIIKPIILLLTLPITLLTLGLFSLVINALMLMLTSSLVSGFHVDGFITALMASIVLSLLNLFFVKDSDDD
jgi:putative membrane protein